MGRTLDGLEDTRDAAAELLTAGPRLVAIAVEDVGDLVAWPAGATLGVAAVELEVAAAAAASTVARLGGRPALDPAQLHETIGRHRRAEASG